MDRYRGRAAGGRWRCRRRNERLVRLWKRKMGHRSAKHGGDGGVACDRDLSGRRRLGRQRRARWTATGLHLLVGRVAGNESRNQQGGSVVELTKGFRPSETGIAGDPGGGGEARQPRESSQGSLVGPQQRPEDARASCQYIDTRRCDFAPVRTRPSTLLRASRHHEVGVWDEFCLHPMLHPSERGDLLTHVVHGLWVLGNETWKQSLLRGTLPYFNFNTRFTLHTGQRPDPPPFFITRATQRPHCSP